MKKDIDNTFIRYGRLHLTKQQGHDKDSFHAPPSTKGFYAMPIRFQELFLIGSIDKTQPDQVAIPKKVKEDSTSENFDWVKYEKVRKEKLKKIIHKFNVKNEDLIWHHLTDVKHNLIIDKNGTWVKTSVRDWKKVLKKESLRLRVESISTSMFGGDDKSTGGKRLEEVRPKTGWYSKDHFEVFFDTKVY